MHSGYQRQPSHRFWDEPEQNIPFISVRMQNIKLFSFRISQYLKCPENIWPSHHPEPCYFKTTLYCFCLNRFLKNTFLTNAANGRLKPHFYLLMDEIEQHYLGTIQTTAINDM